MFGVQSLGSCKLRVSGLFPDEGRGKTQHQLYPSYHRQKYYLPRQTHAPFFYILYSQKEKGPPFLCQKEGRRIPSSTRPTSALQPSRQGTEGTSYPQLWLVNFCTLKALSQSYERITREADGKAMFSQFPVQV